MYLDFNMSSDFYLKAQTLHDEFQKMELHYLNAERKLNNSLMWKKNHSVPLQEYLQNIHQREKKNEESYQSIMEQMNKLDQHTDLLCLKLEKLEIFRNIQIAHNIKEASTLRYMPQNASALENKKELVFPHFKLDDLKSFASTQTEGDVYCDKCRSLIQVSSLTNQSINDSTSSFIDVLSVSKDEPQNIDLLRHQNAPFTFSCANSDDSQLITSSLNAENFTPQIYQRSTDERSSRNELVVKQKYDAKSPEDSTAVRKKQLSLHSNDILVTENSLKSSGNKEILTKSKPNDSRINVTKQKSDAKPSDDSTILGQIQFSNQSDDVLVDENNLKYSGNKEVLTKSHANDSEINVENSVHKSDADSVNNEFDFLESETAHSFSKISDQEDSKSNATLPSNVNKSTNHITSSEMRFPIKSPMMLEEDRYTIQSNKEHEISDNRSEISGSVSGTRSPVISLSDSDSINEKGSFTASAAYQSMLGNTIVPSKVNKEISETESEDEVEKTLARTVRKSNIKAKSDQSKKDKNASQLIGSKPDVKSKAISVNKPQSKLSKSTKKVLGLDTSSSSEIEAVVKPPENKKDEDSDEFDFYD